MARPQPCSTCYPWGIAEIAHLAAHIDVETFRVRQRVYDACSARRASRCGRTTRRRPASISRSLVVPPWACYADQSRRPLFFAMMI